MNEDSWIVMVVKDEFNMYCRNPTGADQWINPSSFDAFEGIHCLYTTIIVEDWDALPDWMQVRMIVMSTSVESRIIDLKGARFVGITR